MIWHKHRQNAVRVPSCPRRVVIPYEERRQIAASSACPSEPTIGLSMEPDRILVARQRRRVGGCSSNTRCELSRFKQIVREFPISVEIMRINRVEPTFSSESLRSGC
jgi:hypothetical protein